MVIKYPHCLHSSESTHLPCQWRWQLYIPSGMLPSCSTHSPAKIFIGMCEKPKMSLRDKRLHKRAGDNTRLLSSSISLHHFRVFCCYMHCHVCVVSFSFNLTVYYNSAVPDLINSEGKAFDYHLFLIFTISESHSEAEEQLFIDRFQVAMCHNTP